MSNLLAGDGLETTEVAVNPDLEVLTDMDAVLGMGCRQGLEESVHVDVRGVVVVLCIENDTLDVHQ